MKLAEEAFKILYPEKKFNYSSAIKYSGRFKLYGANVRRIGSHIEFGLSKKWKEIGSDIKLGLLQCLLIKLFREKRETNNIDLYNTFIRKIHIAIPKNKIDPYLEKSFDRINEKYLFGVIEKPNLKWGSESLNKLGSYEYQTDTITISSVFKNAPEHLLDYILYHETLHKKHKFSVKNGRSYHHTSKFRKDEKKFENWENIEKELKRFCRKGFFFCLTIQGRKKISNWKRKNNSIIIKLREN